MSTVKLMLIRHSLTAGNLLRRYVGITDEPLCIMGITKAQKRADQLPFMPQRVYCSPLIRCTETAEILFPNAEYNVVAQLRECDFGKFEGKTHTELAEDPDYIRWVASEGSFTPPGGESGEAAQARCLNGFDSVLTDLRLNDINCAAVVTHGGVIMRIMAHLFGGGIYQWQPENCGGYLLEIDGAQVKYQLLAGGSGYIADDISDIL